MQSKIREKDFDIRKGTEMNRLWFLLILLTVTLAAQAAQRTVLWEGFSNAE
jgi:hypothetical protein